MSTLHAFYYKNSYLHGAISMILSRSKYSITKFYTNNIIHKCFTSKHQKGTSMFAIIFWDEKLCDDNFFIFHWRDEFCSEDIQSLCPDLSSRIAKILEKLL